VIAGVIATVERTTLVVFGLGVNNREYVTIVVGKGEGVTASSVMFCRSLPDEHDEMINTYTKRPANLVVIVFQHRYLSQETLMIFNQPTSGSTNLIK
jgi:alanine dehydrogenase